MSAPVSRSLRRANRLATAALLLLSAVTPALAGDYTYDVAMPFYAGTVDNAGWIATTCDNCVLNSHDIVGWSLTQTNPAMGPGFSGSGPFTSSSMRHSSVDVQGSGFVATPTGLTFNFTRGNSLADVLFTSGNNDVHYSNTPDFLGEPGGVMEDCSGSAGVCAGSSWSGVSKVGSRAAALSAPELDALGVVPTATLLIGALAVFAGRGPRRSRI